jgi:hypothetical protein
MDTSSKRTISPDFVVEASCVAGVAIGFLDMEGEIGDLVLSSPGASDLSA